MRSTRWFSRAAGDAIPLSSPRRSRIPADGDTSKRCSRKPTAACTEKDVRKREAQIVRPDTPARADKRTRPAGNTPAETRTTALAWKPASTRAPRR